MPVTQQEDDRGMQQGMAMDWRAEMQTRVEIATS